MYQLTPLRPAACEPSSATRASSGRRSRMYDTTARSARSSASETMSVALDFARSPAAGPPKRSTRIAAAARAAPTAISSASSAVNATASRAIGARRADRGSEELRPNGRGGRVREIAPQVVNEAHMTVARENDRVLRAGELLEDRLTVGDVAHPVVDAVEDVPAGVGA